MTSKKKRAMLAWGYGLTALLLTLTVIVSFSAGTAQGLQGTATPTRSAPIGATGTDLERAQTLLQHAQAEADRLDNFNVEAVILLALRSLQAAYTPEADLLLTRMMDRLATIEMVYQNPSQDYKYINDLAVSPDGRLLASAQNDSAIRIYEVQTGTLLDEWSGLDSEIRAIAFSPDSQMLAIGGDRGQLRWGDVVTGTVLFESAPFEGIIESVAFSPNGSTLAVATAFGEVAVYETQTGKLVREYHLDYDLTSVGYSQDGQTLLMVDNASDLYWWDIASGELLLNRFIENVNYLAATLMPDGKHAILALGTRTLQIMDLTTGEITQEIPVNLDGALSLKLSPDGKLLLIGGSSTPRATLYDTATWDIVQVYANPGYSIDGMAFASNSEAVFLGINNAEIRRYSTQPANAPGILAGHSSYVTATAFSPDGHSLMTADEFGDVRIWDAADQHLITQFWAADPANNYTQILAAGFVDNTHIWTTNFDIGLKVWDIQTGELSQQIVLDDENLYGPPSVAIGPDGTFAALAFSYSGVIYRFDLTTGEALPWLRQNNGTVGDMQFSQDGSRLVTAGSDDRVRVFDTTTGRIIKVLGAFSDTVLSVAFTPDATQVLVGQYNGLAQIVDIASGNVLRTFQMEADGGYAGINSVAFSADTVRVMGVGNNGVVLVWDVPSAKVVRSFGDFNHSLSGGSFSLDETHIVTTGLSPWGQVWPVDLATTIDQACAMLTHDFTPEQLADYGITDDTPPCPNLTPAQSAIVPTWTLAPTESLPVWTPLPTLPPTNTPTPSPTPRQFTAQVGENRGSLELGETQQWTYEGQSGEAIQIELRADHPANDTDDATRASEHLLDTYLRVYTTFGVLLAENDDIDPGVNTNSQVIDLIPPYPGTVVIEVTSFDGMTAGGYTLIITTQDGDGAVEITPTPTPN